MFTPWLRRSGPTRWSFAAAVFGLRWGRPSTFRQCASRVRNSMAVSRKPYCWALPDRSVLVPTASSRPFAFAESANLRQPTDSGSTKRDPLRLASNEVNLLGRSHPGIVFRRRGCWMVQVIGAQPTPGRSDRSVSYGEQGIVLQPPGRIVPAPVDVCTNPTEAVQQCIFTVGKPVLCCERLDHRCRALQTKVGYLWKQVVLNLAI